MLPSHREPRLGLAVVWSKGGKSKFK